MKMLIWVRAYTPFQMGGNVNAPIGSVVDVSQPFDLGRGFQGVLAVSPGGQTCVAEFTTGAVIGSDIDTVKSDIAEGDPSVMEDQMLKAMEIRQSIIRTVEPDTFWRHRGV